MRVVDAVGASGPDGLEAADGRLIEFTLGELERLVLLLGGDGLEALCAYLKVLTKEHDPQGRPILTVPDFSGGWVQAHTTLGRNAAYKAQRALTDSGMFDRLMSRPGQGARGKQRACLNPQLVLISGGADGDVSSMRRQSSVPGSRKPGTRESGAQIPGSQKVGTRENGPDSQVAGNWEPGPQEGVSSQVSPTFPISGNNAAQAPTSSEFSEVIHELLSTPSAPGLITRALVPAARRHRQHLRDRLATVLNTDRVVDKLDPLLVPLRLDGPRTQLASQLADYLCAVLEGERRPGAELTKLGVQGQPRLSDTDLVERLVLGLVVGLGMTKPVSSWGGWMHRVTRPEWQVIAKGNWLLDHLTDLAHRLEAERTERLDRAGGGADGGPASGTVGGPAQPAVAGHAPVGDVTGTADGSAVEAEDPAAGMTPEAIDELFEQVRGDYPFFAARATEDPVWRRRVVLMHLTAAPGAADDRATG